MKPACRTIGRERQRLEDIAPNNPISEECWISVPLPPANVTAFPPADVTVERIGDLLENDFRLP
jgi:hypothetical protein